MAIFVLGQKQKAKNEDFIRVWNNIERYVSKAVGGSATSDHPKGLALDLQGTNGTTNKEIFDWAKENLDFDQLIWEYGTKEEPAWVHISYRGKGKNRKQVLRIGVK